MWCHFQVLSKVLFYSVSLTILVLKKQILLAVRSETYFVD